MLFLLFQGRDPAVLGRLAAVPRGLGGRVPRARERRGRRGRGRGRVGLRPLPGRLQVGRPAGQHHAGAQGASAHEGEPHMTYSCAMLILSHYPQFVIDDWS